MQQNSLKLLSIKVLDHLQAVGKPVLQLTYNINCTLKRTQKENFKRIILKTVTQLYYEVCKKFALLPWAPSSISILLCICSNYCNGSGNYHTFVLKKIQSSKESC